MLKRFILYGFTGWGIEIIWTGLGSLLQGNYKLSGYTSIWMFFIYGCAVFLERIHDRIAHLPWGIRGLIWVLLIYCIEYISGFLMDSLFGICPWHYTGKFAMNGYINFSFAPAWFVAGLLFERLHKSLDELGIA
ncbi:hypothetical protein QBE55_00300 [Eubacteriales bacterium mix99]|jgi:uncharacterized membrane protein|nr:hypothetical protein [Clostridiales bacterium]